MIAASIAPPKRILAIAVAMESFIGSVHSIGWRNVGAMPDNRPTFVPRICAKEGVDEIRALRAWLKRGLRDFGLVCVEAYQEQGGREMAINYADAEDQQSRDLFPGGVYPLKAEVILGGHGEDGTLTLASSKRSLHLALVCTVNEGEHRGRKVWDNVTVALAENNSLPPLEPGKLNKLQTAVRIGRARIKALLNSARGLDPNDKSEATEAKRAIESHDDLTGMIFWAEISEEPARDGYAARNKIERIVEPCDADYPKAAKTQPAASAAIALPPRKSPEKDMDDTIPFVLVFFIVSAVTWFVAGGSTLIT
jgi:hypothetical protein